MSWIIAGLLVVAALYLGLRAAMWWLQRGTFNKD